MRDEPSAWSCCRFVPPQAQADAAACWWLRATSKGPNTKALANEGFAGQAQRGKSCEALLPHQFFFACGIQHLAKRTHRKEFRPYSLKATSGSQLLLSSLTRELNQAICNATISRGVPNVSAHFVQNDSSKELELCAIPLASLVGRAGQVPNLRFFKDPTY